MRRLEDADYHDRWEESCSRSGLNGMANGWIVTVVGVCGFLGIGPHSVSSAVGSMAVEVLDIGADHASALAGADLMLLYCS